MGYQALLFCPDEKTARTVTQVLSELDFAVTPCTEPFAAVKKLMAEHFDALVVDCDNEQNATLLFKSARNSPNNHSCLAVAVVEGQAGVAKAFRIGANLVLTKPVNVEQAKGTLRVARGLLRKSEAAKPATGAVSTVVKPTASATAPLKPVPPRPIPSISTAGAAGPVTPAARAAVASIATQKAAPQPRVVASVADETSQTGEEAFEVKSKEMGWPTIAAPEVKAAASHTDVLTPKVAHSASVGGFGTGAASAPAPARELKPSVATEPAPGSVVSEPESPVEGIAAGEHISSEKETSAPATSFTLGGHVGSGASSGRSKRMLMAVAGIALVAAVGYEVWMQWERSGGAATGSVPFAVQPVKTAAKVPQVAPSAPSAAPVASSSGVSSVASPAPDTQPAAVATNKVTAPAPKATGTKAVAAAAPIVIKSGSSRPGAKSMTGADASAPSIAGIASTGNSAALPNLMGGESKAPSPVLQQLHVSQGVSRGLLVKEVQPTYPASALDLRIEGAVELVATVSKNGDVSAVKTVSGDPQLAHAAVTAVKQWKYKPYLLNGEPVEIQTQVTVKFKAPR
jgi:periplasmic protein TonB